MAKEALPSTPLSPLLPYTSPQLTGKGAPSQRWLLCHEPEGEVITGGGSAGGERNALPPLWLLGRQATLGALQACGVAGGKRTVSEEPCDEPGA